MNTRYPTPSKLSTYHIIREVKGTSIADAYNNREDGEIIQIYKTDDEQETKIGFQDN